MFFTIFLYYRLHIRNYVCIQQLYLKQSNLLWNSWLCRRGRVSWWDGWESHSHTLIYTCVYMHTYTLSLFRASYELEMCRRDGVWAGNQYSARYMEVCNLITLSFSGLSLNRPNQTSQPELYFRYYPITSILRHTKANNKTKFR